MTMKCSNIEEFATHATYEQAREMWKKLYELAGDKLNEAYAEISDKGGYDHKAYLVFADWFAELLEEFGDDFGAGEIRYMADEDEDNYQWQNRAF